MAMLTVSEEGALSCTLKIGAPAGLRDCRSRELQVPALLQPEVDQAILAFFEN
jgi:hypothetical protein